MAFDRLFGLHAICVRVGAGHKERGHKNGVSFRIHGLYAAEKTPYSCWYPVFDELNCSQEIR
jgi:hypothetical protein